MTESYNMHLDRNPDREFFPVVDKALKMMSKRLLVIDVDDPEVCVAQEGVGIRHRERKPRPVESHF